MKRSKKAARILSIGLAAALGCGGLAAFAGCGGGGGGKYLVLMSEELDGLFNPFYSTTGADMGVMGETQISMLSTDNEGNPAYGEDEPVVVLDYKLDTQGSGDTAQSYYYFVIKNGIKFSDGKPLTMNDIFFNLYVYLDLAYTGSSTMYSTKIDGLQRYRSQSNTSSDGAEDAITTAATGRAINRRQELIDVYHSFETTQGSGTYYATYDQMVAKIGTWEPSDGYKRAIQAFGDGDAQHTAMSDEAARAQLLADYLNVVGDPDGADETAKKGLFRAELESDYASSKEAYLEEPYKSAPIYDSTGTQKLGTGFDEIISFMYSEGLVEIEYEKDSQTNKDLTDQIKKATLQYNTKTVTNRESAINFVYDFTTQGSLDAILQYWATSGTILTAYTAKAKEVTLSERIGEGELQYPNITGIRSLGHSQKDYDGSTWTYPEDSITIGETTYPIAKEHNDDGTPKNEGEYDVLRIQVNGIDPKAIWNFGFTVAPYHYYSDPTKYDVDIENNKFGVKYGDYDFHQKVIQGTTSAEFGSVSKNAVPMGAGAYVATDSSGKDFPSGSSFYSSNVVYYKANPYFLMGKPKIEYMRYQVVTSANALNQLERGGVHFVEPQFTKENSEYIENTLKKKGYISVSTWQLGYGYIGINAGYVPNRYIRYALMSAMDTSLAREYYANGTIYNIQWPMSFVGWAYPRTTAGYDKERPQANMETNNNHDYTQFTTDEAAIEKIKRYYQLAQGVGNVSQRDLTIEFTIAGSSLTDHPCAKVLKHAMDLLNSAGCGFKITLKADTNALTKLSTGSLAVWAAAWGSTIDPDMYQVYDKNSTATSTNSWGYTAILGDRTTYSWENGKLDDLDELIMDGRATNDTTARAKTYKEAMGIVLDLAIELPVYQRSVLYVINSKVIDVNTLPHDSNGNILINPYTSPLSRIWEVDFVK